MQNSSRKDILDLENIPTFSISCKYHTENPHILKEACECGRWAFPGAGR